MSATDRRLNTASTSFTALRTVRPAAAALGEYRSPPLESWTGTRKDFSAYEQHSRDKSKFRSSNRSCISCAFKSSPCSVMNRWIDRCDSCRCHRRVYTISWPSMTCGHWYSYISWGHGAVQIWKCFHSDLDQACRRFWGLIAPRTTELVVLSCPGWDGITGMRCSVVVLSPTGERRNRLPRTPHGPL